LIRPASVSWLILEWLILDWVPWAVLTSVNWFDWPILDWSLRSSHKCKKND
jgi:hypothetical protein